jgi:hypothetical protein
MIAHLADLDTGSNDGQDFLDCRIWQITYAIMTNVQLGRESVNPQLIVSYNVIGE